MYLSPDQVMQALPVYMLFEFTTAHAAAIIL